MVLIQRVLKEPKFLILMTSFLGNWISIILHSYIYILLDTKACMKNTKKMFYKLL